jgi:hypothetical protein
MNDPKQIAAALVKDGAVMIITDQPLLNFLVGAFDWVGVSTQFVFWFEAFGADAFAGHVLEFDQAVAPHPLGVEFRSGGELIAYLTSIQEADLDNPQEFHDSWQAWKQVAPESEKFIAQVRRELTRSSRLE